MSSIAFDCTQGHEALQLQCEFFFYPLLMILIAFDRHEVLGILRYPSQTGEFDSQVAQDFEHYIAWGAIEGNRAHPFV